MKTLPERWALVTGSSRGIGQQIALGLAAVQCNVLVHARAPENAKETLGLLEKHSVKVLLVTGDLATDQGVKEVIQGVDGHGVPVDILYNNAAIMTEWQPLWSTPKEDWERTFQVNLFAQIAMCNAFAPRMLERGYGRIINLSSAIRDIPQLAPYSVSKAAIDKYTEDLAAELRGSNVLANSLDPGWLRTDMGGAEAEHDVTTVLPGALVPALLEDHGPNGQKYLAQDYRVD